MSETFFQIQMKVNGKGRWSLITPCKNGRGYGKKKDADKALQWYIKNNPPKVHNGVKFSWEFRIIEKEISPVTITKFQFLLENNRKGTFTAKGKKRVVDYDGLVMVNTDVKLNDGTILDAVCTFDEWSSGEHCGTFFLVDGKIYDPQELIKAKIKTREEVFPYSYKYRVPLHCHDHHVNEETGWSN